ncbi:uncharacterized protein ALTATR162_LOCUS3907 [Alternaria atra]|uniref:SnoaL-like domain-containing protein n=1 Tax=Alternaria atra TaxID=119953 RepID=A0A8J2HZ46_9PLEO|nr:uncharacterized protein ALTATR162_LOCUS3907 [Alternaria atra]CAG5155931.1 unnamed protein product [Alternaria atra]
MADKPLLPNLTPREAVADTLHRCILGLDSNNRPLVESACLKSTEMTFTYGPSGNQATLTGWDAISPMFDRVFSLITTHTVSNIRIELEDDSASAARMTAHVISYHVREEEAFVEADTSYTASSLYDIEVIKDNIDQRLWKIKTWKATMLWTTGDIKVLHP